MLNKIKNPIYRAFNLIKIIGFIISLFSQLLFLGYYVYSIIFGVGYKFANVAFLIISFLYLIATILLYNGQDKIDKSTKKLVKKIYKYSKYLINLLIICVSYYAVINNVGNVQFFTKIFLSFKAGFYGLLLIFDYLIFSFQRKLNKISRKSKNGKQG